MPPTRESSLAVVTVSFNSSTILGQFLSSVDRAEPGTIRTVVIDNASPDAAKTAEVSTAHGARFVALEENRGYGAAVNAAIATMTDDVAHVLIANPDVTLHEGAISRLLAALESDPRAAAAGPRILNPDGTVYPSARNQPNLRTGLGHALLSNVWPANPWSRVYRQEIPTAAAGRRPVGWLSGACLLVDRRAFEDIGGFDERYFMYFEDVDLGRRFGLVGRTNVYEPAAIVTHIGAHSTSGSSATMVHAHHESAYRFLSGRYAGPLAAPLRLSLRIALWLRSRWSTRGL